MLAPSPPPFRLYGFPALFRLLHLLAVFFFFLNSKRWELTVAWDRAVAALTAELHSNPNL